MDMRGQSRATEAQTENEDQPQLAIVAESAELGQGVQQQAEMMQKQAKEARKREKNLHTVKTSCLSHLCNNF